MTAVHIQNRVPTGAEKHDTPYEVWFGQRLSVKHLRVFGSIAYALDLSKGRQKLDSRRKQGVLVGYSADGQAYKIYNQTTRKVHVSRDVVFDEQNSGGPVEEIEGSKE